MPHFCALVDSHPDHHASFRAALPQLFADLRETPVFVAAGNLLLAHNARETLPRHIFPGADLFSFHCTNNAHFPAAARAGSTSYSGDDLTYGASFHYCSTSSTLSAETERLGIFPLYYWGDSERAMLATSPSLFAAHPAFRRQLDWEALAQILLFTYPVDNRTLWQGVRRAPQSSRLHWRAGQGWDVEKISWPEPSWYFRSAPEAAEALLPPLRAAMDVAPAQPVVQLLSGGLDSRLLTGLLADRYGHDFSALTFGDEADQEYQIAHAVARSLGIPHRRLAYHEDLFTAGFQLQIANCQGAQGLTSAGNWILRLLGEPDHAALSTGVVADHFLSTSYRAASWLPGEQKTDRAHLLASRRLYGLPKPTVKALLRHPSSEDLVEAAEAAYLAFHDQTEGSGYHQLRLFSWHTRPRHHLGKEAWRFASSGTLHVPFLAAPVLNQFLHLPHELLASREVEYHLVNHYFPKLARLPLDRNSLFIRPTLVDGLPRKAYWAVRQRLYIRQHLRKLQSGQDPRTPYRITSVNHFPGWLRIRELARAAAPAVADIFSPDAIDTALPAAPTPIPQGDAIEGSAGPKTLMGLLLCLARYR
ncbi:MAG: asparagine synthase-related protein [Bryobacter sp.]|nr:asparagine synthase-related protein [Bryobacter sp.]